MEQARFTAYRDLHREVRQLRRQLANMEDLIFSPRGQRFTSTPYAAHGNGRTMDDMIIGHLELKETIDGKVLELTRELVKLEKAVETLEVPIERALMRYRYFEGWSWRRIAEATHFSEPQLYRYHGSALLKLRDCEPEITPDATQSNDDDAPCDYCDEDCEGCEYNDDI